jgi:hypothetical protein
MEALMKHNQIINTILILLLSNFLNLFAYEPITDPWAVTLFVSNGTKTDTLSFGTKVGATDSLDVNIDELAPPAPPSGLSSFFQISGLFNRISADYRSNLDSLNLWQLEISGTEGSNFEITWDSSNFPEEIIPGKLNINNVDMINQLSLSLSGNQKIIIEYEATKKYSGVPVTIKTNPKKLVFLIDNIEYDSSKVSDWNPGSTHTISVVSPQSGEEGTRYIFDSWSDGGDSTHTIVVPDTAISYIANFKAQFTLFISVEPSESGTVNCRPEKTYYEENENVGLKAVPAHNYLFDHWEGDITGTDSIVTLTMENPKQITACFRFPTDMTDEVLKVPTNYELFQNYPNPFNPETNIKYEIPANDWVQISVFNLKGQLVRKLVNSQQSAGRYNILWDGKNDNGAIVSSGIYLVYFQAGESQEVKKMILAR